MPNRTRRKMKIALIGTRGIPASYGGFETCVEEVGSRLVSMGHEVWVYSKNTSLNRNIHEYKGMRIIKIPRTSLRGVETLLSTLLSVVHSLFHGFDMHMVFNGANSPILLIYKLLNKKYGINTDGLEWQRGKWGYVGKTYYKLSEKVTVRLCSNIVSDSPGIHDYYRDRYGVESIVIAYGANIPPKYPEEKVIEVLNEIGVEKGKYILQVTRFEPENQPLLTLQAFDMMDADLKCVLIGVATYRSPYFTEIMKEEKNNRNVILHGSLYDERLAIIWQHCKCYVHGNSVGGTNPALLRAMASGRPIISYDCRFNRDTLGGLAHFYDSNVESLRKQIEIVIDEESSALETAVAALTRVRKEYDWDRVARDYEAFFQDVVGDSKVM